MLSIKNIIKNIGQKGLLYLHKKTNESSLFHANIMYYYYKFSGKLYPIEKCAKLSDKEFEYQNNKERVYLVAESFADRKSKKIYLAMMQVRATRDYKYLPYQIIAEKEYFLSALKFGRNEVYIDCGAYDGDTIERFIKKCPNYKNIIAFEPVQSPFERLKSSCKDYANITLYNEGVYENTTTLNFYPGNYTGSINQAQSKSEEVVQLKVRSIDSLDLPKVTFIKMDIEGAEIEALKGAERTILRDKPKLAICIYHKNEHMLCIPEYIHCLVPQYKLYVRQYNIMNETVLYATL